MIAQFSPLTRRILAVGILVLGLLGLINLIMVPAYAFATGSLASLEDARFQQARLEAITARPPLPRSEPVPASLYLIAPDRQRAADALIAAVSASATRYEVQLDGVAPLPEDHARPRTISFSVSARGDQDKMLAWINDLERGTPAIHFAEWSLGRDQGTGPALAAPGGDPEGAPVFAPQPTRSGSGAPVRLAFKASAMAIWQPAP